MSCIETTSGNGLRGHTRSRNSNSTSEANAAMPILNPQAKEFIMRKEVSLDVQTPFLSKFIELGTHILMLDLLGLI